MPSCSQTPSADHPVRSQSIEQKQPHAVSVSVFLYLKYARLCCAKFLPIPSRPNTADQPNEINYNTYSNVCAQHSDLILQKETSNTKTRRKQNGASQHSAGWLLRKVGGHSEWAASMRDTKLCCPIDAEAVAAHRSGHKASRCCNSCDLCYTIILIYVCVKGSPGSCR